MGNDFHKKVRNFHITIAKTDGPSEKNVGGIFDIKMMMNPNNVGGSIDEARLLYFEFMAPGSMYKEVVISADKTPRELGSMFQGDFEIEEGELVGDFAYTFTCSTEETEYMLDELKENPERYSVSNIVRTVMDRITDNYVARREMMSRLNAEHAGQSQV